LSRRRPEAAAPAPATSVLAVDIGATKMATAVVDGSGRLLGRAETPTDADLGAEGLFAALARK